MKLDKINDAVNRFCEKNDLNLFEVSYQKKDHILSILLDEKLDMDKLEEISSQLSSYLDEYDDDFDDNYFLDVSTVGVERPIRNQEELAQAIGNYIYIKTKDNEYYGDLKSFVNNTVNLEVKEKNRLKTISVDYNNIKKVRYAVKF